MKNILTNYDEAMELVNQIAEFDPLSIEVIICMTIDTESAKYKDLPGDVLDRICTAVHAVNEELGPHIFTEGGHDN